MRSILRTRTFAWIACAALGPLPANAQEPADPIEIPRGPLSFEDIDRSRGLRFAPIDRALAWLPGDSLLVSHLEIYGTGFAYLVNCMGSGFYKVPMAGGTPVAASDPFCALQGTVSPTPDGRSVLYFGEPAYGRRGDGVARIRSGALLRLDLASARTDTLRRGCGSGMKEASLSRGGRLAWTGPCGDSTELAADPRCRTRDPVPLCDPESRAGLWAAPQTGGSASPMGGPEAEDAHDPAWSPDGTTVAFHVGRNPLAGRWEVGGWTPGEIWIADGSGARPLGVAGEGASWSPDGRTLAYYGDDGDDPAERYGGPRIYVVDAAGKTPRRLFLNEDATTYPEYMGPTPLNVRAGKAFGPLVWSPDGRWIVFSRQYRDGASLWKIEVASGRLERLTRTARSTGR